MIVMDNLKTVPMFKWFGGLSVVITLAKFYFALYTGEFSYSINFVQKVVSGILHTEVNIFGILNLFQLML